MKTIEIKGTFNSFLFIKGDTITAEVDGELDATLKATTESQIKKV